MLDALDDEHRAMLARVDALDDPQLRTWAAQVVGVGPEVVDAAVVAMRAGTALPAELLDALSGATTAR